MDINPEVTLGTIALEPEGGEAEVAPISVGTSFTYGSGNIGSGIFYSLNNYFLPVFLMGLNMPIIFINLLASTHSFEGSVVQPIVGAWSDRTWNRFGRRRPFIVWFIPVTALFLIATPFIPGLNTLLGTSSHTLILVLVGLSIFLFSLTFNIAYDPFLALLPDITPDRQRGAVNGVFQVLGALGQVGFLIALVALVHGLGTTPFFFVGAVALILFFIPTVLGIREQRDLPGVARHVRYTARDYWNGLRSDRQVLLFFISQFAMWFGINAIAVNLTIYATGATKNGGLGLSDSTAFTLPLVLLLTTAIPVWPLGVLSDRIGLKRVILIGIICMTVASLAAIVIKSLIPLYGILTIAGFGNAAQTASSYPLLTRMVFPDKMGLYTGLNTSVTSVAAPLSSVLAGGLITLFGFNAMFPFIAACFVIALIPLALINVNQSQVARARRGEAME